MVGEELRVGVVFPNVLPSNDAVGWTIWGWGVLSDRGLWTRQDRGYGPGWDLVTEW